MRSERARDVIEQNERQAIEAQKQVIKAERAAAGRSFSGPSKSYGKATNQGQGRGKGQGRAKGKSQGQGKGKGKKRPYARL